LTQKDDTDGAGAPVPPSGGMTHEGGILPVVRLPRAGPSGAVFAIVTVGAALLLFLILEARRNSHFEPAVKPQVADGAYVGEIPPLRIPPAPPPPVVPAVPTIAPPAQPPLQAALSRPYGPMPPSSPAPVGPPAPGYYAPPAVPTSGPPSRNSTSSALVIDMTAATTTAGGGATATGPTAPAGLQGALAGGGRTRSGMLANRANTVPQGTLIPAVLETAFDSTRPGYARAIVSGDVRGFDGTKVLIPRGSRLVGEYLSDVNAGQKRAVITWTRLIRPDGAIIAIESPAVDPLGRGGVHAGVNNHPPERLLGAFLQSTLQIGGAIATRAATGSVIVALPNAVQGSASPLQSPNTIVPTLRVPAATSISVFVARDLEFNGEDHE